MNKLIGVIGGAALLFASVFGTATAQEVTPSQTVTVSDNTVVVIICTINGVQTQTIPVPEAETPSESDPAVQETIQEQNLLQTCGDVTIIEDSTVNQGVTPTPTTAPTVTVAPTTEKVVERVIEKTVQGEKFVPVVPQGAPATGRGGN